jgi:hypothetical protein
MATITPWTSATPELFLNAARAGAAVGSDIAGRRQQAAMAAAQMAQQANLANLQAAQEQNSLLMRAAAARQEQEMANALNMEKLRVATQESALDRALREREINARMQERQMENAPLELRVLNDPATGKPVGYGYGRTAKWLTEEIPTEGTPMVDPSGTVVANRFGSRVIPIPRDRSYSQAELDAMLMAGKNPFADSAGSAAVATPPLAPRQQTQEAIPLPASERDLVTGRTYITRRGPAVWNGSKFVQ